MPWKSFGINHAVSDSVGFAELPERADLRMLRFSGNRCVHPGNRVIYIPPVIFDNGSTMHNLSLARMPPVEANLEDCDAQIVMTTFRRIYSYCLASVQFFS